jgi:hypothetical protein
MHRDLVWRKRWPPYDLFGFRSDLYIPIPFTLDTQQEQKHSVLFDDFESRPSY